MALRAEYKTIKLHLCLFTLVYKMGSLLLHVTHRVALLSQQRGPTVMSCSESGAVRVVVVVVVARP